MPLDALRSNPSRRLDILTTFSHLSADEVFTPPQLAGQMLDHLPDAVWRDPDLRWLDPSCKSGVYLREAARRLMDGLIEVIPDENERREHILTKMIFGIAITELTAIVTRRTLYYTADATSEYSPVKFPSKDGNIRYWRGTHTFGLDGKCKVCRVPKSIESDARKSLNNYAYLFIHEQEIFDMKFDIIIGNPPYQLESGGFGAQAIPIYHLFIEQARKLDPEYMSFIIPARWFSGGMSNLDEFRQTMLDDRSIKELVDYPKLFEVFPGVEIKGGVCYFLRDRNYTGDCLVTTIIDGEIVSSSKRDLRKGAGVLVRSNEGVPILEKVQKKTGETLDEWVSPLDPFGFPTNFDGFAKRPTDSTVKIQRRGGVGHVERKLVKKHTEWIDKWKVVTPKAGDGHGRVPMKVLGEPIVLPPGSVCTMTYVVAGVFGSEREARNYSAYLASKFVRFLVSLRKSDQNVSQSVFTFVPQVDMKKRWTDKDLYDYFGLSAEQRKYIDEVVLEMKG